MQSNKSIKENNLINNIFFISISLLIVIVGFFLPTPQNLSYQGKMVLFILLSMVVLWAAKPVTYTISTFFMIVLLEIFHVSERFEDAVSGFSSHLMFYALSVFMLGKVVSNIGLHKKIATYILSFAKGSYRLIPWTLSIAMYALAFILPSGSARVQVLIPVVEALNKDEKKNDFIKSAMLILSIVCPIATVGVLTGGGYPMLAAELMKDFGANFSWFGWIIALSPLVFLSVVLSCWVILSKFPISDSDIETNQYTMIPQNSLSKDQIIFILVFVLIVVLWNICPLLGINYAIPTFIGLLFLSASSHSFFKKEDIKSLNWDELIMLGGALSIGQILNETGAARWVVDTTMHPAFNSSLPVYCIVGLIFIIMIVTRFFFVNPSGWLVVLMPLLLNLSTDLGISTTKMGLTIAFFSGIPLLPICSPPSLLVFGFNHYSIGEYIACTTKITAIALLLITIAWFVYWPVLGF